MAGCGTPPPVASPAVVHEPAAITMTDAALGPLTATTRANLVALRELLSGYEVKPVNGGSEPEYEVFRDGHKLFAVVGADGGIFNVDIVSPKVSYRWRVGDRFHGAAELTTCECWGGAPVCFASGAHVAVGFDSTCDGLEDAHGRQALAGRVISHMVWSPRPFVSEEGTQYDGDDPCSGDKGDDGDDLCSP